MYSSDQRLPSSAGFENTTQLARSHLRWRRILLLATACVTHSTKLSIERIVPPSHEQKESLNHHADHDCGGCCECQQHENGTGIELHAAFQRVLGSASVRTIKEPQK
jgi:hypothetical protein